VACVKYTDLFATGSCSGDVILWKVTNDNRISESRRIPVLGWITDLQFSPSGNYLLVAVSCEPKHGRWDKIKQVKNGIMIIGLE